MGPHVVTQMWQSLNIYRGFINNRAIQSVTLERESVCLYVCVCVLRFCGVVLLCVTVWGPIFQTAGTLTVYWFTYSLMDCLKTAVHSRNMWQEYWNKKVYAYVHGTCVLYALCIEWVQFWMEHMSQWLIGRKWWIQAECQHGSWCSVFRSAAGSPARCARCASNSVSLKLEAVLWLTPGNTDCASEGRNFIWL